MDYPALNKLFLDAVDRYANPKAQYTKTANGWESIVRERNAAARGGIFESAGRTGHQGGRSRGNLRAELRGVARCGFRDYRAGCGERAGLFQRVRGPADVHPERFGRADRDHQGRGASAENCRSARAHARCSNT